MQTLKELKSGSLKGCTHLTLSENLTSFPLEILSLADTLEFLDLSNNKLSDLPQEIEQLSKLQIAFFSNNLFNHLPTVFKNCSKLFMLGFKANQIKIFKEDSLPLSISWLILTDNRLTQLPRSIGKLTLLRKFPLAGNQLTRLPKEMENCRNLELLRISANELTEIPSWLLKLPKLAWLAFSGNPCAAQVKSTLSELDYEKLELSDLLGQGASGEIYKAYSADLNSEVAVKIFKAAVTSDGYAIDEMHAYMSTGEHPNLIQVLAKIAHDKPLGLVLELIASHYDNLGLPPTFETCTRDTFKMNFDIDTVYAIIKAMLDTAKHLHNRGLMHGDLYAHNILIDPISKHIYFGDFGAASFYDTQKEAFERVEVRAFGCLIEDLLNVCLDTAHAQYQQLSILSQNCRQEQTHRRPLFSQIILA